MIQMPNSQLCIHDAEKMARRLHRETTQYIKATLRSLVFLFTNFPSHNSHRHSQSLSQAQQSHCLPQRHIHHSLSFQAVSNVAVLQIQSGKQGEDS